jgi:hypothetical protein
MSFDVVVMGAGAAGLFCAGVAGQLGLRVLLLDHSEKVAEKIRISGGGRCNFTNRARSGRAAQALPRRQPALLPLGAVALHAAGLHRAGAAPRHRLPRKAQGPAVLRPLGRRPDPDAAGRVWCRPPPWAAWSAGSPAASEKYGISATSQRETVTTAIKLRATGAPCEVRRRGRRHRRAVHPEDRRHRFRLPRGGSSACAGRDPPGPGAADL